MVQQRKLGEELEVSAISLGTMTMPNNEESVRTIQGALDLGVTMFDTADYYGDPEFRRFGENEKLVGRALKGRRDEAIIATKFGITHGQGPKGDPAYIKKSVDASLYSLGLDYIDLYYQHRPDPDTPSKKRSERWPTLFSKGRSGISGYRRRLPTSSGAPMRFIRLPQSKPNIHCGAGKWRMKCSLFLRSWASALSLTVRLAAAF